MSKTIVTGGAGFIGSHLVERLIKDGHEVTVIDNLVNGRRENLAHIVSSHLHFLEADVCDRSEMTRAIAGAEWVFHLAALADIVPSITNPEAYFRANVSGTLSVLEAARAAGVKRFLYVASSSCYGFPETVPTPEKARIQPQYPYALTKYLGEQMVLHWAQVYGLPAVALRLFNVYGPRSRTNGTYGAVFGVFLAQKLHGKPFTIVGDGTQKRDFTFVTDVVDAFLRAAKSDISGEVFNVGTGNPQSVNRLVELLGAREITHIPKRPGEPDITCADFSKIKNILGWESRVSFEEGVAEMLCHIEAWKNAPVWTLEAIGAATKEWFRFLSKTDTL